MVLCCTVLALPAWSAPPLALEKAGMPRNVSNSAASSRNVPLDLRPPPLDGAALGHFSGFGRAIDVTQDARLAGLADAMNHDRPSTRMQAFMQRFHREGLPIARLWQGHAALVSVGLNPKGKPGLWYVKQTH